MRTQGNAGNGNRWYGDQLSTLRGRLASEGEEHAEPGEDEDDEKPHTERCEHGVPLWKVKSGQCHNCAWLYGWEIR